MATVLTEAGRGKIFSERTRAPEHGTITHFRYPGTIVLQRIVVQGLVRPAVMPGIALCIAGKPVDVEIDRARHGGLVDAAGHAAGSKRRDPARKDGF